MRRTAIQFVTLARMTIIESVRQPVFLILALSSTVLTALLPVIVTHTLGESARLMRDSALAIHLTTGLLLGGLLAGASLRREMQRGTAATVLSKPVSPECFFLAKFAGLSVVLLAYSLCSALSILIGARILHDPYWPDIKVSMLLLAAPPVALLLAGLDNFFTGRPFVSKAFWLLVGVLVAVFALVGLLKPGGGWCAFGAYYNFAALPASALITLAVFMLIAICLALASVLDTVPALSVASVLFFLGLISDYAFGRFADSIPIAAFFYRIIPNWQHFWGADAIEAGGLPWGYVGLAAFYAILHLAGWLLLGMVALRHLEWKT